MSPYHIKTIEEYHRILGIGAPEHPLISVINLEEVPAYSGDEAVSVVFDFYMISLKETVSGNVKYKYGQQQYDFDNGMLFFLAPRQVFSFQAEEGFKSKGWMILIHPDFMWGTSLAKTIGQYGFFDYAVNEALFISEKEEQVLVQFITNIEREYRANVDQFSEHIIVSQLESLLSYSERFYQRQFFTRKISNHGLLDRLEKLLDAKFKDIHLAEAGIPTVNDLAAELNISPNYLSNVLKVTTGLSTQQHIHGKVVEKAKEKLSTTGLTVSEIAYGLGFEYTQSFSKLFKSKTGLSPLEFRQSFH
ncbi:AraC family transcriptional regulator [Fluviicola sp.]|uniref:helix-turn-helix domain-containing protein n=1 Tax=Fluviicola sp. TaxID=1917219 RepID=UPI0031DD7C6B